MSDPREVFPPEVVALHDEKGVPWPNWFSGPLMPPDTEEARKRAREAFERYQESRD